MILAVGNENYSFYKQNKIKYRIVAIFIGTRPCFCVKSYNIFLFISAHFKIILRYLYSKKFL